MVVRKRKIRRNTYKRGIRQRRQNRIDRIRRILLSTAGLLAFLAFNLVLIMVHDWITQTDRLPIAAVEVEGMQRLRAETIRRRADIHPDGNILAVNLGAARRRLEAHPWIAEARVIREIPDRIIIRIREHDCRAVLNLERQFLISPDGVIFKERQNGECADVPLISGIDYADLNIAGRPYSAPLAAAMALLDRLPDPKMLGKQNKIQEIRVDPDLGLTLFVSTPPTQPAHSTIILGFTPWEQKYQKLSAVQAYLERRDLVPDGPIFNLRTPERIVISPGTGAATAGSTKEV
jgi:cell division protein FtsQ